MRMSAICGMVLLASAVPSYAAPAPPPFATESVKAAIDIKDISLEERDGRMEVTVSATRPASFAGQKLKEGHRYYVDFQDCRLAVGKPLLALERTGVTVRAAQFSIDPAIVRVVVQTSEGIKPGLRTSSPAEKAVISFPAPPAVPVTPAVPPSAAETSRFQTRIEFSALPPSLNRPVRPSRSRLASRGGGVNRLDPSEFIFPPDAMEAFDDPPVPSTGGSLTPVTDADLPEPLKEGAKIALSGNRKYVWGGETPKGFDCSGMVQFIYRFAGIQLPRTAAEQYRAGVPVEQEDLQPGDLLFFTNGKRIFHVGMYIGNGRMFHAANPRRGLTTDLLSSAFYANHYAGARRPMGPG